MQFDAGSMGPKVTACAKFVSQCRGIAGIGSLADGPEILAGDKGTLIRLDTPITTLDPFYKDIPMATSLKTVIFLSCLITPQQRFNT